MSTRALLQVRSEAFGSVFLLAQHLTRLADRQLAEHGLTTRQWLLLAILTKVFPDRSPSLSEAAHEYGSSRQNVKQIALGLEAAGFVRLVSDPADARATRIETTDRVRLFDSPAMARQTAVLLDDVFAGLSPDETVDLRDLLQRWVAGLTDTP